MLSRMRARLNALPRKTKERVLSTTMLALIVLALIALLLATPGEEGVEGGAYEGYLGGYIGKYWPEQEWYNRFVFYLTQEGLLFRGKQLKESYYEEVSSFANLTEPEFQELYHIVTSLAKSRDFLEIAEFEDNYFYDWAHFLPPVKDMKYLDASHLFAVTAALEFEANKKYVLETRSQNLSIDLEESFISLSEQEVIDCCPACMEHRQLRPLYEHLKQYGISTSDNYPFASSIYNPRPQPCRTLALPKPFRLRDYYNVTTCRELAERLAFGPVVVWVDARSWRDYEGGIWKECPSSAKRNHFALVVGRGIGYWKVRNSWGERWGEHGHIRVKSGNSCGICRGSFPEID